MCAFKMSEELGTGFLYLFQSIRNMSTFSSTRANAATAAPSWGGQQVAAISRRNDFVNTPQQQAKPPGPIRTGDRWAAQSDAQSMMAEEISDRPNRPAGYHVEGLHAYIWSTQPVPVPGIHTRDAADLTSQNVRLSVFDNRCTLFCYERGVELETVWAKDMLNVFVRGGTVSLTPTPCSAQSVDDHGEFVVRKLLSGVVMKRPVERPRVRTWAAMRLVFDADATAQEVGTALEALKIRHMQTIPKRLSADNAELEKAMVLQHKARSLLASLGVRPEGVLSLAAIGAAQPSQSYLDEVEEVVDSDAEQDELLGDEALDNCEPFVPFGPVVQSLLHRLNGSSNSNSTAAPPPQYIGHQRNQYDHHYNYSQGDAGAMAHHSPIQPRQQQQQQQQEQYTSSYSPLPIVLPAPPPKMQPLLSLSQPSATTISTRSIGADQTVINIDEVEEIFPSPREDATDDRALQKRTPEMPTRQLPPPAPPLSQRAVSPLSDDDEPLSEVSADEGAVNVRRPSRRASSQRSARQQQGRQSKPQVEVTESRFALRSEPAAMPSEPVRDYTLSRQDSASAGRSGAAPDDSPRTCRWCKKVAPPQHDAKCTYREMKCKKCGERSLLRDLKSHVCKAN